MARSFNGTSNYLASASALTALAGKTRLAVAFWYYGTFNNDDNIVMELTSNAFSNPGSFVVVADPSGGSAATEFGLVGSTHFSARILDAKLSNSTWHHILVNYNWAGTGGVGQEEVESIYVDGTAVSAGGPDSAYDNPDTFISGTLYVMSRAGSSLFTDGRMSDLCIWAPATALGSTEALALSGGARANAVRNSEILYYWPLSGASSPEPATVGSVALTVSGATQVADPPALTTLPTLTFSVSRTDSTHTSLTWTSDATVTNGITIVRCAGDKTATVDGAGKSPGASGYDPTTISGASIIASAVTTSPYADTVPSSGTYTYWINRTA